MTAVLDYHLHLWPHGPEVEVELTVERVAAYCERAEAAGVVEVALTEHLFRFRQAADVVGPFWDVDPDPVLRRNMAE